MNPLAIKALGVLLIVGALYLAVKAHDRHVFKQGEASMKAEWDRDTAARKDAETNAILARTEENRLIQKANDAKTKRESDAYQNKLAELRKSADADRAVIAAAGGLRDPGVSDPAPGISDAQIQCRCDGAVAGTGQLSERSQEFLLAETDRADQIVEQARACQNEARAHGLY